MPAARRLAGPLFALAVALVAAPAAAQPCPENASPDRPWSARGPATSVEDCVFTEREGQVARGVSPIYNLYCPTRVSLADAQRIGRDLAEGRASLRRGYNPVRQDAERAKLTPSFRNVAHRYEYACALNGKRGVATHLKVRVTLSQPEAWREIGWSCKFNGGQNGGLGRNLRMDREYRCSVHYRAREPHEMVMKVAQYVIQRDMLAEAQRQNLKLCILPQSNFQCAPCETSDKLVARVKSVGLHERCPAGSLEAW